MKKSIAACAGMLLAAGGAFAAEAAFTVRPTEVKAKPFTDAPTVASLGESSKVDVIERKASWLQVKAPAATGWIKMLSVRFDQIGAAPKAGSSGSALNTLYNISQTGSGGAVATTGVKGISEQDLKNPRPNAAELQKMHALDTSPADAEAFAKAGKLSSVQMNYVAAPGGR
jgi:hypothetical protein